MHFFVTWSLPPALANQTDNQVDLFLHLVQMIAELVQ